MDWSITTLVEGKRSAFRNSWSRVVRNAESIAALRGSDTEAALLRDRFSSLVDERTNLNRKLATFDAGNSMLWNYLLHNMCGTSTSFARLRDEIHRFQYSILG